MESKQVIVVSNTMDKMKYTSGLIWILIISFTVLSCARQNEYAFPLIQTGDVTDIDSTGAVFHARISDLGNGHLQEFGFLWGPASDQGMHPSKLVLTDTPGNGTFSTKLSTDLFSDTLYYVRAYAKNESYTTFGKTVQFRSKGSLSPVITDFSPREGTNGTQVIIIGKNFGSTVSGNLVKFGRATALVTDANNDRLVITLPENLDVSGSVSIMIKTSDKTATSASKFILIGCNISDFAPKNLMIGDTIYVHATDFGADIPDNTLIIGGSVATILSIAGNVLVSTVPYNPTLGFNEISLSVNGKTCYVTDSVFLKNPWSKIEGNKPFYRSQANGFSIGTNVYIGFGISINNVDFYPFSDLNKFDYTSNIWTSCLGLPGEARLSPVALSAGEKGYVGFGSPDQSSSLSDFYEYDPKNDKWTKTSDFPGVERLYPFGLGIGNKVFIGMGSNYYGYYYDFWEYDPGSDKWTQLGDFPGDRGTIYNLAGFSYGGKGYIVCEDLRQLWEYTPGSDSWKRLADFPGPIRDNAAWFVVGNYGYLGTASDESVYFRDFWRYDIANDIWIRIADMPYEFRFCPVSFSIGNKGLICSGYNKYFDQGTNAENFIVFDPN